MKILQALTIIGLLSASAALVMGAVDGSITGTVKDQTDRVIVGATVVATNTAQGIQTKTVTDEHGLYAFPSLAVGTYELEFQSSGFRPFKRDRHRDQRRQRLEGRRKTRTGAADSGSYGYRQPRSVAGGNREHPGGRSGHRLRP